MLWPSRRVNVEYLAVEDRAPAGVDGFEEDVFDGQDELLAGVELAAALGLSDMDPVGSAIAESCREPAIDQLTSLLRSAF